MTNTEELIRDTYITGHRNGDDLIGHCQDLRNRGQLVHCQLQRERNDQRELLRFQKVFKHHVGKKNNILLTSLFLEPQPIVELNCHVSPEGGTRVQVESLFRDMFSTFSSLKDS